MSRKRQSDATDQPRKRKRDLVSLEKVISGGQTGADRAALEAAREAGIPTGGFAANGFKTTAGVDLSLKWTFGLEEMDLVPIREFVTHEHPYVARSKKNVDASDATIAFRMKQSAGTDKTIGYCYSKQWRYITRAQILSKRSPYKPCLVIESVADSKDAVDQILAFLGRHKPKILNVCGHRDDATAGVDQYTAKIKEILAYVFETSNK